jgi:hypothetical protein
MDMTIFSLSVPRLIIAGTFSSPAFFAALSLLSPAINSKPFSALLTKIG